MDWLSSMSLSGELTKELISESLSSRREISVGGARMEWRVYCVSIFFSLSLYLLIFSNSFIEYWNDTSCNSSLVSGNDEVDGNDKENDRALFSLPHI